jgi:hypothetical protein
VYLVVVVLAEAVVLHHEDNVVHHGEGAEQELDEVAPEMFHPTVDRRSKLS